MVNGSRKIVRHRFSAFWLRSKCSICSYQLNIWYVPHRGTSILNWFLELGEDAGACSDFPTGWPGIAVPPGSAHSPRGVIFQSKVKLKRDNVVYWVGLRNSFADLKRRLLRFSHHMRNVHPSFSPKVSKLSGKSGIARRSLNRRF